MHVLLVCLVFRFREVPVSALVLTADAVVAEKARATP